MSPATHHWCDGKSIYDTIYEQLSFINYDHFMKQKSHKGMDHITNWLIKEIQINAIILCI